MNRSEVGWSAPKSLKVGLGRVGGEKDDRMGEDLDVTSKRVERADVRDAKRRRRTACIEQRMATKQKADITPHVRCERG